MTAARGSAPEALVAGLAGPAREAIAAALEGAGYAARPHEPSAPIGALGRMDLLVTIAGPPAGTQAWVAPDRWEEMLGAGPTRAFAFAQAMAGQMEEGGAIVNVWWHGRGGAADAALHGAGEGLTKAIAIDLGSAGIRVNCVSAGGEDDEADVRSLAQTVAFLGGRRSGYVTGSCVRIGAPPEAGRGWEPGPPGLDRAAAELERSAVVTGAGGWIGRAICLGLARNGLGVACWDVDEEALEATCGAVREAGGTALGQRVDICDSAAVGAAVEAAVEQLGPLQAAVNNAGVLSMGHMLEMSPREWERVMRVNLTGCYHTAIACGQSMAGARLGGAIVNVGSVAGVRPMRNRVHYCASKAGVHGLTAGLARDLAADGVRSVAVAPKAVVSGMSKGWLSAADGKTVIDSGGWVDSAEQRAYLLSTLPVGRPGRPEDVADLVSFLASPAADRVSGVTIGVDGGFLAGDPVTR